MVVVFGRAAQRNHATASGTRRKPLRLAGLPANHLDIDSLSTDSVAGFSRQKLETALSAPLYPLHCPISDLPIGGYRPDSIKRPRPAAVLVGVTADPEPGIVLTLRSRALANHAGQVAFPGGGRDAPGESVVETALREAHEETGIEEVQAQPLGYLGRYDTITGFRMTAVVALLDAGVSFTPDRSEVDAVFKVALAHVMDPDRYRMERVRHAGQVFEIVTLEHAEHHIWGATAALLRDFGARLRAGRRQSPD